MRSGVGRIAFRVLPLLVLGTAGCHRRSVAPPPLPTFSDRTEEAGLRFVHDNGAFGAKYFPEIMGSGCALFDANGDGRLDIFLVNGSPMPGHPHPRPQPCRLYLNQGNGSFVDATKGSGLDAPGFGMGVAVGDVNNDGADDLYLTRMGRNSLYLNQGNGRFREVTVAAGVAAGGFSTSAAFVDIDNDGLLDLYVCRYVPWSSPRDDYRCVNPKGRKQYCDVQVYEPVEHLLFRNRGAGSDGVPRFEDVSRHAGIAGHRGRGLAVVCGDYDGDGATDILVANDENPNFLWKNDGHGRFQDVAAISGFAYTERGAAPAGMGLDMGDVSGSGFPDVIESDFQGERKTLYVNDGHGFFTANGGGKGLGDMPRARLAFGVGLVDFDLDGWPDIFLANGHVVDDIEEFNPGTPFAQSAELFRNVGAGRFEDVSAQLGEYARARFVGRGAAFGDFDDDGDPDILVSNNRQRAVLLRNENRHAYHWLGVRCEGRRSNRDGIGAKVTITAGGRTTTREVRAASSYLSSSDRRVLFGLGPAAKVDRLRVTWPGGAVQELSNVPADRYLTLIENTANAR